MRVPTPENQADAIITRNKRDFERSSINVFDCDELFAYLKQEKNSTTDSSTSNVKKGQSLFHLPQWEGGWPPFPIFVE